MKVVGISNAVMTAKVNANIAPCCRRRRCCRRGAADLAADPALLQHGCGHLLWPTAVKLPNNVEYTYCVVHQDPCLLSIPEVDLRCSSVSNRY